MITMTSVVCIAVMNTEGAKKQARGGKITLILVFCAGFHLFARSVLRTQSTRYLRAKPAVKPCGAAITIL